MSSAPPSEIRATLERHGLDAAFHGVAGYPQTKTGALREVAERHHPVPVLYFGDAPADLAAALAAGIRFAAVNPNPGLAAIVDEHFDDFTRVDRRCVDRLIRTTAVNDPSRIRQPPVAVLSTNVGFDDLANQTVNHNRSRSNRIPETRRDGHC